MQVALNTCLQEANHLNSSENKWYAEMVHEECRKELILRKIIRE